MSEDEVAPTDALDPTYAAGFADGYGEGFVDGALCGYQEGLAERGDGTGET